MNNKKYMSEFIKNFEQKMDKYYFIKKLYGPLFKRCVENSLIKNDFDLFHIPYFEFLLISDINLAQVEKDLEKIYKNIGNDQFEQLCNNLNSYANHKTINGIHNKLLDFYSELKAMLKFIDEGYAIKLIPCSSVKTPDFQAIKANHIVVVECKFKHSSNPIHTYIKRLSRFLGLFYPPYQNSMFLSQDISFEVSSEFPRDLTQENIDNIKEFISDIVHKQLDTHTIVLSYENKNSDLRKNITHSCKIMYQRNKMPDLALIPIHEQAAFVDQQLREFDKNNIERLINTADRQINTYIQDNHRNALNISKHIFILVQLDDPISMTWESENLVSSDLKKRKDVTIKNVSAIG